MIVWVWYLHVNSSFKVYYYPSSIWIGLMYEVLFVHLFLTLIWSIMLKISSFFLNWKCWILISSSIISVTRNPQINLIETAIEFIQFLERRIRIPQIKIKRIPLWVTWWSHIFTLTVPLNYQEIHLYFAQKL